MQKTPKSLRSSKSGNLSKRTTQTYVLNPSFATIHWVFWLKDAYENAKSFLYRKHVGWTKSLRSIRTKFLWGWDAGVHCLNQGPCKTAMWLGISLAFFFTADFQSSWSLPKLGYCNVFLLLLYHLLFPQVTRYRSKDICCLWITLTQTKINS